MQTGSGVSVVIFVGQQEPPVPQLLEFRTAGAGMHRDRGARPSEAETVPVEHLAEAMYAGELTGYRSRPLRPGPANDPGEQFLPHRVTRFPKEVDERDLIVRAKIADGVAYDGPAVGGRQRQDRVTLQRALLITPVEEL